MLSEIVGIKTRAIDCNKGLECKYYKCQYKHSTKTGLSLKAEQMLDKSKQQQQPKKQHHQKTSKKQAQDLTKQMANLSVSETVSTPAEKPIKPTVTLEAEEATTEIKSCLDCPVCLEQLKEPTIVVPCMHTFCKKCIGEWA